MNQFLKTLLHMTSGHATQQTSQRIALPQGASMAEEEEIGYAKTSSPVPNPFERMEEYKAILDNLAQVSARRQHVNQLYASLNTVFLTGLGILLLQTHLNSWWIVAVVSAITLAILPLNLTWRKALIRYKDSIAFRYEYLEEIENEFRLRRGEPDIGIFLRFKESGKHLAGHTHIEIQLATYFLWLYPLITLIMGLLVYLVKIHFIPPLTIT
jgi:hypothetical protein